MKATKYLISVEGALYGYDRLDLLRIDISIRKPTEYALFEKKEGGLTLQYDPIELPKEEVV